MPSRLAAEELTGEFGPNSTLTTMTGVGHAGMEETTATGAMETASGDRLTAKFDAQGRAGSGCGYARFSRRCWMGMWCWWSNPRRSPGRRRMPPMRATAGHAVYEGAGKWLHLTVSPRVEDGAMQLTADKVDVSQESGDAFSARKREGDMAG